MCTNGGRHDDCRFRLRLDDPERVPTVDVYDLGLSSGPAEVSDVSRSRCSLDFPIGRNRVPGRSVRVHGRVLLSFVQTCFWTCRFECRRGRCRRCHVVGLQVSLTACLFG